jgi:hypothetical protein
MCRNQKMPRFLELGPGGAFYHQVKQFEARTGGIVVFGRALPHVAALQALAGAQAEYGN